MTDLTVIPLTRGQAIYKIFTLGDYLYMNKHQRIDYLLQGAMQHDWLGFSTECSGDLPVPSCVWNPIPQLEELLQKKKKDWCLFGVLLKRGEQIKRLLKSELLSESIKSQVILDRWREIRFKWYIDPRESLCKSVATEPAAHPSDPQCVCVSIA